MNSTWVLTSYLVSNANHAARRRMDCAAHWAQTAVDAFYRRVYRGFRCSAAWR